MKENRRPSGLCKVTDLSTGLSIEVDREVYKMLEICVAEDFTGTLELDWNMGNVGATHIREGGRLWRRRARRHPRVDQPEYQSELGM